MSHALFLCKKTGKNYDTLYYILLILLHSDRINFYLNKFADTSSCSCSL